MGCNNTKDAHVNELAQKESVNLPAGGGGGTAAAAGSAANNGKTHDTVPPLQSLPSKQKRKKSGKNNRLSLREEDVEDYVATADEKDNGGKSSSNLTVNVSGEGSYAVKVASLCKKGYIPYSSLPNQDRELVTYGLQKDPKVCLFAVMDGHGEFGHEVSHYIKHHLVPHLEEQLDLRLDPVTAITKGVKDLNDVLIKKKTIDLSFSGATMLFVLKTDKKLYCANIGDCRAIVVKAGGRGPSVDLDFEALSSEHTPDKDSEAARISKKGGRIKPLNAPKGQDPGPLRVWLKETEAPGLTMTRAIGDEVGQTVGVIAVPEITAFEIEPTSKFLVLGTDGLFRFLSNINVSKIVWEHQNDVAEACKALYAESKNRWKSNEEVIDDMAIVLVDLRPTSSGGRQ